ncbi:MAG: nitroreductase family protein [Muribaculaceae bacterium]|nr:nitroreductase family protein [Muribaculaceae bacterium]
MENLHDLLVKRRSIRHFTDEQIDAESVKLILEAGLLAPTSKSSRAWQFIVVDDRDMLERLSQCKERAAEPIARCSMAVVVAVDPTRTEPWIEDASVAAAYMQLQAADLGLGSVWIQVRDRYGFDGMPAEEYVQEALGMPDTLPIVCILAFGHPAEERKPATVDKLKWENVHIGQWSNR